MRIKIAFTLFAAIYLTGCVKYVSGYSRSSGSGSAESQAEDPSSEGDVSTETCLKLAQKRKAQLKLADEGEAPAEDTTEEPVPEETSSCPTTPEEPSSEETTEEAPAE